VKEIWESVAEEEDSMMRQWQAKIWRVRQHLRG
jgi:outer membrane protein TolC